jgi:predicted nucleic acid-binding protein
LSSSPDVRTILRRLKPEKRRQPLKRRGMADLPFIAGAADLPRALLYDTTVYVDILQGRFPHAGEFAIRAADGWHSTVTEAELIAPCGSLNPDHPGTAETIKQITRIIERRPAHRTIAPDREVWLVAGILAGMLARLQGYGREHRRRVLNDALIFATARKHGMTVLTRNVDDFDLLQQLDPAGHVVFYSCPVSLSN